MIRLIRSFPLIAGLALLMHAAITSAQTFPTKPLGIIVAFGPGVVDTGAGGNIAAEAASCSSSGPTWT